MYVKVGPKGFLYYVLLIFDLLIGAFRISNPCGIFLETEFKVCDINFDTDSSCAIFVWYDITVGLLGFGIQKQRVILNFFSH